MTTCIYWIYVEGEYGWWYGNEHESKNGTFYNSSSEEDIL